MVTLANSEFLSEQQVFNILYRVDKTRMDRKVSMRTLGAAVGVSSNYLSRCFSAQKLPSTGTLYRIAEYFGTSMDYLMCRTDNPQAHKAPKAPEYLMVAEAA